MAKYEFNEKEMNITGYAPVFGNPTAQGPAFYDYPCTPREAFVAAYEKKAIWLPYSGESSIFCPEIIPDNIARGFVIDSNMFNYKVEDYGGNDMFGVEWVYVPVVGGSMEKPGNPHPLGEEVYGWKEKLNFPDIDSWDWDKSARENEGFLNNNKANMFWFLNGMGFERLISFMGFENAAMALLDEDQEDELKELFEALTDLHIKMVDRACEAYGDNLTGFTLHDDWGSQRSPFFSEDCAEEFLVPCMKRFTDHVKSKGKLADLHSCGHIEDRITSIINGGWQSWTPMPMNDTKKLYEEYGDKIIIGVCDTRDESKTYAEQAQEFIDKYYSPEKPCTYSLYGASMLTPEYVETLYKASRIKSSK